jgi:hypothetical protein
MAIQSSCLNRLHNSAMLGRSAEQLSAAARARALRRARWDHRKWADDGASDNQLALRQVVPPHAKTGE